VTTNTTPTINEIIETIKKLGGVHLGGDERSDDIDFFIKQSSAKNVHHYLISLDFFIVKESSDTVKYAFVDSFQTTIFDFTLNLNYFVDKYFYGLAFKQSFVEVFLTDPSSHINAFRCLKYLFKLNAKEKYTHFFISNITELTHHNFYLDNLSKSPFKKLPTPSSISPFLERKLWTFIKTLKFHYILNYLVKRLEIAIRKCGKGKAIIILGTDGVGKTTVVNCLASLLNGKHIYMGSNEFRWPKLSKEWEPTTFIGKLLKLVVIYLENVIKTIRLYTYRLKGYHVIIDRHPRYNYFYQKRLSYFFNAVAYHLFLPAPSNVVILYEEASTIVQRKQERTVEEIDEYYDMCKQKIPKAIWIKNTTLNKTVASLVEMLS